MRIGLLTSFLAVGDGHDSGIGQHHRLLADALSSAGHAVRVLYCPSDTTAAQAALAQLSPAWSWEVIAAPLPRAMRLLARRSWATELLLRNLWAARSADRALARLPADSAPEIIETHGYYAPGFFLVRRRRRPFVVTRVSTSTAQITSHWSVQSRLLRWHAALERAATRRSDGLLTHTRAHRDEVCRIDGYPPARFALVPHGVVDPGEPDRAAGPLNDAIEFLFVGRFERRKGIDVLLAAIPAVAAALPRAIFTLAGATGDGSEWRRFVTEHPELAAQRVCAPGRVSADALQALYRRCSVFVAPSRYESFGLIYAEAMSYGKPVIGCAAGGVAEVVTEGVTGLLTPPGDVASLVAAMRRLGSDPSLRHQMGHAARSDFLARFSVRTLAARTIAYYAECLAPARSRWRGGPA